MARQPYELKPGFSQVLNDAVGQLASDEGAYINGYFGERGVLFFPTTDGRDDSVKVGFATLGKDHPIREQALNREQAANLVKFLVSQYGFEVSTETVTVVNII